jgi:hypothetical protein
LDEKWFQSSTERVHPHPGGGMMTLFQIILLVAACGVIADIVSAIKKRMSGRIDQWNILLDPNRDSLGGIPEGMEGKRQS